MALNPGDPQAPATPRDEYDEREPEAPAREPADTRAPPPRAGKPAKKRPWWRPGWVGGTHDEREPKASKCVIMGPSGAGKTLLLMSLDRCAGAESHSYADRYNAYPIPNNDAFTTIENGLQVNFEGGLRLEASRLEKCFLPEFTLRISDKNSKKSGNSDTLFRSFDGAGGLLEKALVERFPESKACRQQLDAELENCDTVLLCLPIMEWIRDEQEKPLKEFIDLFMGRKRIRRLVVCFTMYELLAMAPGANLGRHAYRELANRGAARKHITRALTQQLSALNIVLRRFHDRRSGREVWCTPVSSYGFVKDNGGANLARIRARDTTGQVSEDYILRTRPASRDNPPPIPERDRPYDYYVALKEYWQPFLTLDPFIFIATGDREGTLIHSYDELWQ